MAGSEDRPSTMKIQVTLKSASVINDVDVPSNSKVYAVAWIEDGSRPAKQKTQSKEGYSNPRWNDADPRWNKEMSFMVEEEALQQDLLRLKLELRTKKTETTGGKKVGDVSIPIKFLGEQKWPGRVDFWSYRVRNPSGKFTGKINLTLQVIKPISKLNDIQSAVNRSAPTEGKERKKEVALTTRMPFTPPTIESPLPPPPPHAGSLNYLHSSGYPSLQHHPHSSGYPQQTAYPYAPYPQAAASLPPPPTHAGYPAQYLAPGEQYPPQQAFTPLLTHLPNRKEWKKEKREERKKKKQKQEERKKKKQKQEEVLMNAFTELALPYPHYPLQWQYPSSQHYPPSSGYPYSPFTLFTPPDYPQQAPYPNPNPSPNPTFPHTAAPPPPQHAGYTTQYLAPGGQYPLQQAYPQQGGHTAYSGYPYDQGRNIPYIVFPPAQQLAQQQRT